MNDREQLLQVISDLSKEAYGFRLRLDYEGMSNTELEALYHSFIREAEMTRRDNARRALKCQHDWENWIGEMVTTHGVNRATALRWDMEAHDVDGDIGFYCYLNGLDYALEDRVQMELEGRYVYN